MISIKKYSNLPFNMDEILRYMGCATENDDALNIAKECLKMCEDVLTYSVCFDEFPISFCDNDVVFPFAKVTSLSLLKHLKDYEKAVIFAGTVGIGLDRFIMKYSRISPSHALAFQAIGAERIEALCDAFCDDLKSQKNETSMRFSPGYGDFPLQFQTEIFKVLDCNKRLGISLNSALLMSPSKSVTAIIGVK
ncbi:MAG: hypothetical protein IK057_01230 [Clostridia bacterium]|nr:hypothetical protein [Clostridia bacterium]